MSIVRHVLQRTSPKGTGEPFIGRCLKCGKEGLTIFEANDACPNDRGLSDAEAFEEVLRNDLDRWAR